MGCVQTFAPPPRGGCRPVEGLPMGLGLRSKWKGRRGEYCGKPSMHASTWSIRRSLDSLVAGAESRLPRRPRAVRPPSRPLPFFCFHAWISHSWPRHPPSRRGADPGTLLGPCIHGIRETLPLERFRIFCSFPEVSRLQGHAEAQPSRCALHGEGRASARPQWKCLKGQKVEDTLFLKPL